MEILIILESETHLCGLQVAKFHNEILIEAIMEHFNLKNRQIFNVELDFIKSICHLVREMETETTAKNIEFLILFMENRINFPQFVDLLEGVGDLEIAKNSGIKNSDKFSLYIVEGE